MRSIYTRDLDNTLSKYLIEKKSSIYHHLINVIRIKNNEQVLLFDGLGLVADAVIFLNKNVITLEVSNYFKHDRKNFINLYFGITKRDSFKNVIQNATECGINNIYPVLSEFSQKSIINVDKMNKIIISSMEQSNNFIFPILHPSVKIEDLQICSDSLNIVCDCRNLNDSHSYNNQSDQSDQSIHSNIFIGPEGGWSSNDLKYLVNRLDKYKFLKFNTPILRTYNAVVYTVSQLLN